MLAAARGGRLAPHHLKPRTPAVLRKEWHDHVNPIAPVRAARPLRRFLFAARRSNRTNDGQLQNALRSKESASVVTLGEARAVRLGQ